MPLMTPQTCRMARAALRLTVQDLAEVVNIHAATIQRFESGQDVRLSTVTKLQTMLEKRGAIFQDADEATGPGVRLKKKRRKR